MNGPESWSALASDMDALVDLPPIEREARLVLIARSDAARAAALRGWLDAIERSEALPAPVSTVAEGSQLGPWRVVRVIGLGRTGEVFLGERADGTFDRRVAIKLLRTDRPTPPERLVQERALLARLRHPGIAQFLDGGVTSEGRPYLVTEWVDGVGLDAWLAREKPTIAQRVEMLRQVADAVADAHANLVVHRDLKPANVMVDARGRARLLGFGIARLLDGEDAQAEARDRALTPAFAAPEQLAGEAITTRTDVYALGALLYWLLTGRTPHETENLPLAALVARVCGSDPLPPSAAGRGIDRDLDAIALMALERDPARRYPSADALRADLERWQRGDVVAARVPTRAERMRRWIRAHRAESALAAVLVVALLAGIVGVSGQARTAARERDAARAERAAAQALAGRSYALNDFLTAMLRDTIADEERLTPREMLARGAALLGGDPHPDPESIIALAGLYGTRGDPAAAIALLEPFVAQYDPAIAADADVLARCTLASMQIAIGKLDEAGSTLASALPRGAKLVGTAREPYLSCLGADARLAAERGDGARALARIEEAIAEAQRLPDGPSLRRTRAKLEQDLANVHATAGRSGQAVEHYRRALAASEALGITATADDASTRIMLAGQLGALGRPRDADAAFAQAIADFEKLGARSVAMANGLLKWAALKNTLEQPGPARELIERAQAIRAALGAGEGVGTGHAFLELGKASTALADYPRALEELAEAERVFRAVLGDDHADVYFVEATRARALLGLGRIDDARRAIARAVDWARAGDARGTLARVMPVAVEVELAARDYDKAVAIARESLAFGEETAPGRPGTAWSRALLGHALVLSGDAAAGKPLLEAATAALSRELGPEHSRSRSAQAWLLDAD